MKKNNSYLLDLIKSQKDNFSLDQSFYTNKSIFEMDLKTFFFNQGTICGMKMIGIVHVIGKMDNFKL